MSKEPVICQECRVAPVTEKIYMDSDSFGIDYLYTCAKCKEVHFALIEATEENNCEDYNFIIKTTVCEFNGTRDYLVDCYTGYRVRLWERTRGYIKSAVADFVKGMAAGRLYKMSL